MKSIVLDRFGGPDVLALRDGPALVPAAGQALVRVAAAGVNFADTLMRRDAYVVTPPLPIVLGSEAAGVVTAVGDGVDAGWVGRRVAAPLFASGVHFGGYAEALVIDARFLVALPDAIDDATAVALQAQGLSARHLVIQADPRGKSVLVTAAAGGVGSLLIQLARLAGAATVVAAASSAAKLDLARSLGADAVVDYSKPGWDDAVLAATGGTGPDVVYDSVGGDVTKRCLDILAPRGRALLYGALNPAEFALSGADLVRMVFKNQWLGGFALVPLLDPEAVRTGLAALFDAVARGDLTVLAGGTFPFSRVGEAHAALESRRTVGKVVLVPDAG